MFGLIRSMIAFKLIGMLKHFLVIGSDSGRIVVLEFDQNLKRFVKVHQETYGKTGCRRIVPGEYLAADPNGRVILIGAVERQKFAFQMNRDGNNRLVISSPLEAHKPHTVTLDMAIDNGLENPQFACLEIDYGEPDDPNAAVVTGSATKTLVIYEVDLGLNHVVRKFAEPLPSTAHALVAVPGGVNKAGPGGVLVACENFVIYKKQDHSERRCTIPVRFDQSTASGVFITNSQAFFSSELGAIIFLQSEHGDLYKVSLDLSGNDVLGMSIMYFDTIAPSTKLVLLEAGYLFAAGDCSNHYMYRFTSLGGDQDAGISNSSKSFEEAKVVNDHSELVRFCPRADYQNLEVCDEL
jgi:splicing factor 3B subunit 3